MFLIANADDVRLKFFAIIYGGLLISSCTKNVVSGEVNEIRISKIHGICASAPTVIIEKSERGPDFEYGVLLNGYGHEVEYYSSSQSSHRDKLIVESEIVRELRQDKIVVSKKKYSDGKSGISLSGYMSAFDKKPSVKVEYFFSSQDSGASKMAEALAVTSRNCGEPATPQDGS